MKKISNGVKIKNIKARPHSKISRLRGREILDSRGWPTVEVDLETSDFCVKASVPSGASVGKYEVLELRDGEKRYKGRGVLKAVENINEIIGPKLIGKDPTRQKEIDEIMIELDGTENKLNLGTNAILAVSMAVCRAGAKTKNLPLYQYINGIYRGPTSVKLSQVRPVSKACFNIINGGVHAGNDLDFQEFMICPQLDSFSKNLQAASEIYHNLKEILKSKFGKFAINVGDEGGFSPPLFLAEQALDLISLAIGKSGYKDSVKIALDIAASEFFSEGKYKMRRILFTREGLLNYYLDLLKKYPIFSLEDPFAQDDFEGWRKLNSQFQGAQAKLGRAVGGWRPNSQFLIFGDDLLATNIERIKMAKEKNLCNGLILKINQVGTITETLEAAKLAKSFGPEGKPSASYGAGWKIMVSHRSGETSDDFISDLAVGIGADFIKAGAPARGERVAKYNRLLEIEEEINKS